MSDKPITLADVRAHIERRVMHCEELEAAHEPTSCTRSKANAVRYELAKVLAMLDRVPHLGDLEAIQKAARDWHDASLALGQAVAWREPNDVLRDLQDDLEARESALFAIAGPALSGLDRVQPGDAG